MIRSAQDVIVVARSRGFDVRIKPGPERVPELVCPKNVDRRLASETLINALKAWRPEIIEILEQESMEGQTRA